MNPIALSILICKNLRIFSSEILNFEDSVRKGGLSAEKIINDFHVLADNCASINRQLGFYIGVLFFILLLGIFLQLLSVAYFRGEIYSLVYTVLNVWCLMWIMNDSLQVHKHFVSLRDTIFNLKLKWGLLGSEFISIYNNDERLPTITAELPIIVLSAFEVPLSSTTGNILITGIAMLIAV